jgi:hypothetical protein
VSIRVTQRDLMCQTVPASISAKAASAKVVYALAKTFSWSWRRGGDPVNVTRRIGLDALSYFYADYAQSTLGRGKNHG